MMMVREAFKQVVKEKGKRMKRGLGVGDGWEGHLRELARELGLTREVDHWLLGALDAMIFDMGQACGFTTSVFNARSYDFRKEVIKELWASLSE